MNELRFDDLIRPLERTSFFRKYFGRRPAVLRGEVGRFAELDAQLGTLDALAQARRIDAAVVDGENQQQEVSAEPEQLRAFRAAGMTLCADVSNNGLVASLLERLRTELRLGASSGFAKLYWSAPGKGFAPHFDPHHVFVLQLAGAKRWWFEDAPAVPWTTSGAHLDRSGVPVHSGAARNAPVVAADGVQVPAPSRSELRREDLSAGDVLYLPPGTWHTTEAIDESRALSVSPARLSMKQLLVDMVATRLASGSACERDLAGPADVELQLEDGLAALQSVLGGLHASQLRHAWHAHVFRSGSCPASPRPPEPALGEDSVLIHTEEGIMRLVPMYDAGDKLVGFALFRDGVELGFPPSAQAFLEALVDSPRFTVGTAAGWDPTLTWDATRTALASLVDGGFLRRASG